MEYSDFQGLKISKLAFGTMRLPCLPDGTIDQNAVDYMTDAAIMNGINYFDTAYPYHGGNSEVAIGKALSKYPRDSYFLATKYPGHQTAPTYNPAAVFERQLKKCGVDYFDFYLLHNVYEKSIDVYLDPQWGIIDYFLEQRRLGRIKHLGFSSHGRPDNLEYFLSLYGKEMEFCQIQLNWLDMTLQDAAKKVEILNSHNIPIWVMEPVRGGRLTSLPDEIADEMKRLRPNDSVASWSFRWLLDVPGVTTVLSGMSDASQMADNIKTFSSGSRLSDAERAVLDSAAKLLADAVPCTGCRYCCDGCPMELNIPYLISLYNDLKFGGGKGQTPVMQIEALPEDRRPSACIGCGACEAICPQAIPIPRIMEELASMFDKAPKWADICKIRAAEQPAT